MELETKRLWISAACIIALMFFTTRPVYAAIPALQSSIVNGDTITLAYDQTLSSSPLPSTSDFAVTSNARADTKIADVSISGNNVIIRISPAVQVASEVVYLSYLPGTNPVRSSVGQDNAAAIGTVVLNEGAENGYNSNLTIQAPYIVNVPEISLQYGDVRNFITTADYFDLDKYSFRLHHLNLNYDDVWFNLPILTPSASSQLKFQSMIRKLTVNEKVAVQVATEAQGYINWVDTTYVRSNAVINEIAFSAITVSLAAYANQKIKIRFINRGIGNFYDELNELGWFIDSIEVNNLVNGSTYTNGALTQRSGLETQVPDDRLVENDYYRNFVTTRYSYNQNNHSFRFTHLNLNTSDVWLKFNSALSSDTATQIKFKSRIGVMNYELNSVQVLGSNGIWADIAPPQIGTSMSMIGVPLELGFSDKVYSLGAYTGNVQLRFISKINTPLGYGAMTLDWANNTGWFVDDIKVINNARLLINSTILMAPTNTSTATPTATATRTATNTLLPGQPTYTPTHTPTATATFTATKTPTNTATSTNTVAPVATLTPTATATYTAAIGVVATKAPTPIATFAPTPETMADLSALVVNPAMTPLSKIPLYANDRSVQLTNELGIAKFTGAIKGRTYKLIPISSGHLFDPVSQDIVAGSTQALFVGEVKTFPSSCTQTDVTRKLLAIATAVDKLRDYGISLAATAQTKSYNSDKLNMDFANAMTASQGLPELTLNCAKTMGCSKKPLGSALAKYRKAAATLHKNVVAVAAKVSKDRKKTARYLAKVNALNKKVLATLNKFSKETYQCS